MSRKHVLSAGMSLLALGLVTTAARAAPTAGFVRAATVVEAAGTSLVEKTHWYGRRYYRPHYYGYYSYPRYYGYEYYPRYHYYPRYWHRHHRHHY